MVSQRSYLSIGDVLSLLREEFPDVTISKIRFLESQGLVDPERSPSGYRKFYEHDVARLRWVLRQQRDQFLPLRVIRDRLAAAGDGVPPDEAWPEAEEAGEASEQENGAAPSSAERASSSPSASPRAPAHAARAPRTAEPPAPAARAPAPERSPARHVEPAAPEPPAPAAERPTRTATPAMEVAEAAETLAAALSGVSLTLAELCAATGLTGKTVASLEALGLIEPMPVAGGSFYDEEALTVGKLAAEFARFGIEPRHLKLYRNAADREVGLVEQVITPLLRQRNPEARQRAVDAAGELARLGQRLRASLVRSELRRQLGT